MKMSEKLKYLVINTSVEDLTEVYFFNQGKKSQVILKESRQHLKNLIPTIKNLLEKEKTKFGDLDFVALNEGPGSWTGLRIGFATVKVLAMLSRVPLIVYNNFELISKESKSLDGLFLIKCSETNYFYRHIKNGNIVSEGVVSEVKLFENYSEEVKYYLISEINIVTELVEKKFNEKMFSNSFDVEPMYLTEGLITPKIKNE